MSRVHSSLPSKSKAFSTPVPVITHTLRPSVTGEGDDMFCFCMRRVAAAEQPLPSHGAARAIDAPEIQIAALGDVQENTVAPDDRRGARPRRHGELPGDVLGLRPAQRQIGLAADAVQRRPTPLRPVLGGQRDRHDRAQQHDQERAFSHQACGSRVPNPPTQVTDSDTVGIPCRTQSARIRRPAAATRS